MRTLVLRVAWHYCYLGEKIKKKTILQKIYTNGMKRLCLFFMVLNCYFRRFFKNIEPLPQDDRLPIVSLTSFPERIDSVWMVIDSIYNQSIKPQKIVLVLTKEEFPFGMQRIPQSLKRYLNIGLEIVFTDYNLKPHNKYYYALSLYKENDVITIDDDLYYWPDTIERLYMIKGENPGCICANRAYQVVFKNNDVAFIPPIGNRGITLSAQGVGGVLYIPAFRSQELFNKDIIKKYCLNNDDNWLKVQQMLCGIKVAMGREYPHPLTLLGTQKKALWYDNVNRGISTNVSKSLIDYYHLEYLFNS